MDCKGDGFGYRPVFCAEMAFDAHVSLKPHN
jgi:hypothetical protein